MSTTVPEVENAYLYDIYHLKDKMILWFKLKNSDTIKKLEYPWSPFIYVASDTKSDLEYLLNNCNLFSYFIKEYSYEYKYEYPSSDQIKKEVLKLTVKDSSQILNMAKYIEGLSTRFGQYRLYNVDVSPEQSFFYEKEFFPFGLYSLSSSQNTEIDNKSSNLLDIESDNIDSYDYIIPNLRSLTFDIVSDRKSLASETSNKILAIKVRVFDYNDNNNNLEEKFTIKEDSEIETILQFSYEVSRIDPNIILTTGGDQFLFPHLFNRAREMDIALHLLINLNRELDQDFLKKKNRSVLEPKVLSGNSHHTASSSQSYISYGKVYFKPKPFLLFGRIHVDTNTSFIYKNNGLDGLVEISKICRMSPQITSRSTIGKCLSSLYFYNAYKKDVLVPWKPITSEIFKTFNDLIKADRGGTVFESKPGAYDKVAEYDFVSLYPNIMLKKNISSETINCECCKDEQGNKIPGLEHLYHSCRKRKGIVPISLEMVLKRRLYYKEKKLESISNNDIQSKIKYDNRQDALKWILVTSFGYLGFSNSKFGRIDAHIAVCAYARDILLKTSKIAERYGFEIIHGIVDSIWIKSKKENNSRMGLEDKLLKYKNLKEDIEKQTDFSISFEGIYKWIVFDSSKTNSMLPALNRYFGAFMNGTLKMRGIETRRHDTPPFFVKFQEELLQTMATFDSVKEINGSKDSLEDIYNKYRNNILSGNISFEDLIFTKRLSKNSVDYLDRNTIENCVLKILSKSGKVLNAGEEIKYVITDFRSKNYLKRALPLDLVTDREITKYDAQRYCDLLLEIYDSVTKHLYEHTA
jgi:DNA polymerase-2